MLYGGGTQAGRVIGCSTRDGGEPAADGLGTPNLISTILNTVLNVAQVRLQPSLGAIARLGEASVIPGLS
jgi:hypothetical protein